MFNQGKSFIMFNQFGHDIQEWVPRYDDLESDDWELFYIQEENVILELLKKQEGFNYHCPSGNFNIEDALLQYELYSTNLKLLTSKICG